MSLSRITTSSEHNDGYGPLCRSIFMSARASERCIRHGFQTSEFVNKNDDALLKKKHSTLKEWRSSCDQNDSFNLNLEPELGASSSLLLLWTTMMIVSYCLLVVFFLERKNPFHESIQNRGRSIEESIGLRRSVLMLYQGNEELTISYESFDLIVDKRYHALNTPSPSVFSVKNRL